MKIIGRVHRLSLFPHLSILAHAKWWLGKPNLAHFAFAIGDVLGGYKPGFWWTLIIAVVAVAARRKHL
jgi:hypothetical protein